MDNTKNETSIIAPPNTPTEKASIGKKKKVTENDIKEIIKNINSKYENDKKT